jgi:hypothetical protein
LRQGNSFYRLDSSEIAFCRRGIRHAQNKMDDGLLHLSMPEYSDFPKRFAVRSTVSIGTCEVRLPLFRRG